LRGKECANIFAAVDASDGNGARTDSRLRGLLRWQCWCPERFFGVKRRKAQKISRPAFSH